MNIVCTIDSSYAQHCAVMLASLCCYNSNLNIFIIHNGLTRKKIQKLERFLKALVESLSFIEVNDSLLLNCPLSHHVSVATYFRLLIPEVIPQDIDKILFLDSDIIIRKDISPFWETDVTKYSHAAVESPNSLKNKERLGIPHEFSYFNAGVLLINLDFWRRHKVFLESLKFINFNREKIVWWDQDVLNYLLHPYWLAVDPIWNAQGCFWSESFETLPEAKQPVYQTAIADPAIVHFSGSGRCKPWDYYCLHPFKKEYRQHLRQTPWRGARLSNQPNPINQLKSKAKAKLRNLLWKADFL